MASNRPEDLDDAVLDRMDELVEFPLPAAAERARILRQHVDGALNGGGGGGGGEKRGQKKQGAQRQSRVDCSEMTAAVLEKAASRAVGFSGRELAKVAASVQALAGDRPPGHTCFPFTRVRPPARVYSLLDSCGRSTQEELKTQSKARGLKDL